MSDELCTTEQEDIQLALEKARQGSERIRIELDKRMLKKRVDVVTLVCRSSLHNQIHRIKLISYGMSH